LLEDKFRRNLSARFPAPRANEIETLCMDQDALESTPVDEFMGLLVVPS